MKNGSKEDRNSQRKVPRHCRVGRAPRTALPFVQAAEKVNEIVTKRFLRRHAQGCVIRSYSTRHGRVRGGVLPPSVTVRGKSAPRLPSARQIHPVLALSEPTSSSSPTAATFVEAAMLPPLPAGCLWADLHPAAPTGRLRGCIGEAAGSHHIQLPPRGILQTLMNGAGALP